jgi:activating signal cointegrator complex subunit 3
MRMTWVVGAAPAELLLPFLQAYVSRVHVESFSLTADMMYVSQNAPRIARAIFEICLRRGWSSMADWMLTMCKARDA